MGSDRLALMGLAAAFAAMPAADDLGPYAPRAVAHQLRRIAVKPSHAKRAKVKAARKQNRSKK